ncbi:hypothetical protein O9Z70_07650 [Devosia sp. YIM 151766]|uniref:hypothetical protein n=1 Tax=Devosia sp. YIM 151766 TaxID=3017325 RepID=UPI00255D1392|nr:hypothetical protein [Devosia sp. YIM 151766]WIY54382.1 hypothetical protein O9Z70_07650 [Devosia sp. YIM 151766]
MKLTWFGASTFRIHIGGQVVVIDAEMVAGGIEPAELVSGADQVIGPGDRHEPADGASWKPRARERLLDAGDNVRPVRVWSLGAGALLLDGDEDMPLLVLSGDVPGLGRWAERAVIVLAGQGLARRGRALVEAAMPRLVALAGSDAELDEAFAALPAVLEGAGLIALEPGLAVEV